MISGASVLRKATCYSVSLSFSPDLSMPVKILFEPSKISSIESNLDNPFHLEAWFCLSSITIHSRISYVSKRHLCGRRESMVSKDVKRKKKVHESKMDQNGSCQGCQTWSEYSYGCLVQICCLFLSSGKEWLKMISKYSGQWMQ